MLCLATAVEDTFADIKHQQVKGTLYMLSWCTKIPNLSPFCSIGKPFSVTGHFKTSARMTQNRLKFETWILPVEHKWGAFDLTVFKVILGLFSAIYLVYYDQNSNGQQWCFLEWVIAGKKRHLMSLKTTKLYTKYSAIVHRQKNSGGTGKDMCNFWNFALPTFYDQIWQKTTALIVTAMFSMFHTQYDNFENQPVSQKPLLLKRKTHEEVFSRHKQIVKAYGPLVQYFFYILKFQEVTSVRAVTGNANSLFEKE